MFRYERRVLTSAFDRDSEGKSSHRISYRELEKLLMNKLLRKEARELLAQAKASPGRWFAHGEIEFRRVLELQSL